MSIIKDKAKEYETILLKDFKSQERYVREYVAGNVEKDLEVEEMIITTTMAEVLHDIANNIYKQEDYRKAIEQMKTIIDMNLDVDTDLSRRTIEMMELSIEIFYDKINPILKTCGYEEI